MLAEGCNKISWDDVEIAHPFKEHFTCRLTHCKLFRVSFNNVHILEILGVPERTNQVTFIV